MMETGLGMRGLGLAQPRKLPLTLARAARPEETNGEPAEKQESTGNRQQPVKNVVTDSFSKQGFVALPVWHAQACRNGAAV